MRCVAAALLALAAAAASPLAAQQPTPAKWRVQAALVVGGLDVKPVPLHPLRLVSATDSMTFLETRTDLQGTAEGEAPAGDWVLTSASPLTVEGIAYRWTVPVALRAGAVTEIRLDNTNATVDSTSAARLATSGRRVEDAVTAYRRVRRGVFRIEAGLGHGSGFLVDPRVGLVVTNAHVVSNQVEVSVVLDSVTRVGGQVLARDEEADVAVVRVHPANLAGRESLPLADPRATGAIVESGERVFAVGYPLSQEQTLTTGIVSSIRQGAIISDVNINPGTSGGRSSTTPASSWGWSPSARRAPSAPGSGAP